LDPGRKKSPVVVGGGERKRTNKFELEKSIEEAENRLHQSKSSLRRSLSRKES